MSDERDVLLDRREEKYEYHVEGFDGPLDVLLFLIKKNELNIYNIDISLITEQFLEYIREHEAEIEELSDFYQMAAELLYIKSRTLLPTEIDNDDDEFEDPRQELVDKLIEYQKYKKYTELLINGRANNSFHIERNENFFLVPFEGKDLFRGVTAEKLLKTFTELMSRREPEAISKIFNTYEEVSLEEKKALTDDDFSDDMKRLKAFLGGKLIKTENAGQNTPEEGKGAGNYESIRNVEADEFDPEQP